MDKMGSSNKAGTKGIPSTPRAGSPVQLVGLLYKCLTVFQEFNDKGYYSFSGVDVQGKFVKYAVWANKIKQNFDYWYYLPENGNK